MSYLLRLAAACAIAYACRDVVLGVLDAARDGLDRVVALERRR